MPNWCQNDLAIKGPKEFLEELAETEMSLRKLVPWPKEFEELEKVPETTAKGKALRKELMDKYGVNSIFDWCVTKWGTKWDIELVSGPDVDEGVGLESEPTYFLSAVFDTAWSPPVEAYKAFYEKHKDKGIEIYLYYMELGCMFLGSLIIKDGKIEEEDFEYKTSKELEAILEKHENPLAEGEVENLRDREEMDAELEERKKQPKPNYPPGKIPAKYTGPKTTADTSSKPVKKSAKPAKKVAAKSTVKPAKKAPAKPAKKTAAKSASKPAKKAAKDKK